VHCLPSNTAITAETLNQHYSSNSTHHSYTSPLLKQTCCQVLPTPSEFQVFTMLDQLKRTAKGPDGVTSWFLKIGAPILARPLSHLYQLSVRDSVVPTQWKNATILPLSKIPQPSSCSDYRPISLTPVICRTLERLLLKQYFILFCSLRHTHSCLC